MNIIDKVLSTKELQENPPVLIDIGASGKIYPKWKTFSKHAICIAFDADQRDFNLKKSLYKKIHTFNCIVHDTNLDETDFHLTHSPHCSSLLKPDAESLKDWSYASLFKVEKIEKVKTVTLTNILQESGLDRIDWYKSDSQGIDLRLFKSLPEQIRNNVLIAEFEPGILSTYIGEDKLHQLLAYMDQEKKFWAAEMIVKGAPRVDEETFNSLFPNKKLRKLAYFSMKGSASWAEVSFLNSFNHDLVKTKRNFLLGWVFSTIENQPGFALKLAEEGSLLFPDELFAELKSYSTKQLKNNIFKLRFYPAVKIKLKQLLG